MAIFLFSNILCGQDVTNERLELNSDRKCRNYFGIGLSNSLITSLPDNLKQRIGFGLLLNSASIHANHERLINSRFSFITGAEISLAFHEFDNEIVLSNSDVNIIKRNDSILSSLLTLGSINVPVSIRLYFSENDQNQSNEYLQFGLRVGYGFLNGIDNRLSAENYSLTSMQLTRNINPFRYGLEFVFGKKNPKYEFYRNSSFSIFIQLNQFTNRGNMMNARPVQFSWRIGI